MRKIKCLAVVLVLLCALVLLSGCGCEHEWVEATCTEAKTCSLCGKTEGEAKGHTEGEWAVTLEPVEGKAGERAQLCAVCGEALASEEYSLSAVHDGSSFTLTVEEFAARINNILGQIRPDLSCRIESNKVGEPTLYTFWKGEALLTIISPVDAEEKGLSDTGACPEKMSMLFALNTTQQTAGDNPIPVMELQLDTVQALIMACDPEIAADEARQLVTDFLDEGGYVTMPHGSLEYYFFLSNIGQPLLNVSLSPLA